jgi:predicted GTPase
VLAANKIDIDPDLVQVRQEEGLEYAREKNMKFYKVSAKLGKGVEVLFEELMENIIEAFPKVGEHNPFGLITGEKLKNSDD